jgi:CRISPR system Cascade subunit CasA
MNLVTEPWIPVTKPDGTQQLSSLLEVFTPTSQFADLAVRPHERIALMRLLICIAQAALEGPVNKHWKAAPDDLPEAANHYLNNWLDSFNLFDAKKPFFQIPTIEKLAKTTKTETDGEPDDLTSVSKLDFALATGNNTTLFDHGGFATASRSFPPASLALMLLTFQQFSPGGLIAKVQWGGKETSKSSAHAPCTPASMLHTFLRSDTLYDTLCVNLLSKETVKRHFNNAVGDYWGKPIWELMPSDLDDKLAVANATQTYLGRLLPLSRLCWLQANGSSVMLGNGLAYPAYPEFSTEPSATLIINRKQERQLLGAGSKAIWRELPALIVSRKQNGEAGGALSLENLSDDKDFDIWVGALLTNKASILDTVESVFHIPAKMQTDMGRSIYDEEVRWAEAIASKLSWAVETYREQIDHGWEGRVKMAGAKKNQLRGQLHATATRHYWTAVEKLRPLLMAHITSIGTTAEAVIQTQHIWKKAVRKAAHESYRLACGQETPRQMRAFALGWAKLVSKPKDQSADQHADTEIPETEETEA